MSLALARLDAPTRRYTTKDGKVVTREGLRITIPCDDRSEPRVFDFSAHPFAAFVGEYVLNDAHNLAAGSVGIRARHMLTLEQFMAESGRGDLDPVAFAELLRWLRDRPGMARSRQRESEQAGRSMSEKSRRAAAQEVLHLYGFGTPHRAGWTRGALDTMTAALRDHFRGEKQRFLRRKNDEGVSPTEYARLLTAIRMELEAVERAVRATPAEMLWQLVTSRRGGPTNGHGFDPNPYVCFGLLAALEGGLRAPEFNVLTVDDAVPGSGILHGHAPNKPARDIATTEQVEHALDLARRCSDSVRAFAPGRRELLLAVLDDPTRPGGKLGGVHPVTSFVMGAYLRRFYAKYFDARTRSGTPVLFADPRSSGDRRPLAVAYADHRAVGLTAFARVERNPDVLRRHAGHISLETTELYYIHEDAQEHGREVARRLATMAERLRMVVQSRIVERPPDAACSDLARRGALLPLWRGDELTVAGHCQEAADDAGSAALAAGSRPGCVRSGDCRRCEHARYYADRLDVYRAIRDAKLSALEDAIQRGSLREAENLRESAALDEAIVQRICDHLGTDDA